MAIATPSFPDENNPLELHKPTSAFVAVNPEMAARWLERNRVNRPLDAVAVSRYATMMSNGDWTLDSNAIVFDTDGYLIQGQHRLHAVIKSGATITFNVVRNAPRESMRYMDRGRTRTIAQNLRLMDGERNSAILSAATRLIKSLELGGYSNLNDSHVYDFVAGDPHIRKAAYVGNHAKRDIDAPPSAIAAAYWFIASVNGQDVADNFILALKSRTNLQAGSPILAIDRRLRIERRSNRQYKSVVHVLLILRGWNYYAAGRQVKNLTMPDEQYVIPKVRRIGTLD